MTEYTISYARFLLRSWGFTRKVPMGRHVKRASRQKIAWFRKKLGPLMEERMRAGYTACVQDEAICMADARLRKGVYTPKGVRCVYTYTGSHSKTIVFGLIMLDGEGFFQRYDSCKCSRHLGVFCHLPAVDPVTSQGNDPKRSDAPAISGYVITSKLNGQIFIMC